MNYRLEGAIRKNRGKFIVIAILWLILTIVFVVPITYATCRAGFSHEGLAKMMEYYGKYVSKPISAISQLIKYGFIGKLFSNIFIFTIVYLGIFLIGFIRSAPKHRYDDIEHGSSDWSQHGEQYRVLSKKEGIVLAENNYLPVDKKGNVNVMIIGRFRCW